MFMLSTEVLKGGNAGNGFEMYFNKQFVTITGQTLGGTLFACTNELLRLHDLKFPPKPIPIRRKRLSVKHLPLEETPRNIARVWELLSMINADCDYETYRNTIWAIEALGWKCGEELQRQWSLSAPHRFQEETLQRLRSSFEPAICHIGFGTLSHLARAMPMTYARVQA
jgi:hypothetical protein